jgi:hypothetical protein
LRGAAAEDEAGALGLGRLLNIQRGIDPFGAWFQGKCGIRLMEHGWQILVRGVVKVG